MRWRERASGRQGMGTVCTGTAARTGSERTERRHRQRRSCRKVCREHRQGEGVEVYPGRYGGRWYGSIGRQEHVDIEWQAHVQAGTTEGMEETE